MRFLCVVAEYFLGLIDYAIYGYFDARWIVTTLLKKFYRTQNAWTIRIFRAT